MGTERSYQQDTQSQTRGAETFGYGVGKSTLVQNEGNFAPVGDTPGKAPDFELGMEHTAGAIKTSGKLKVDVRNSALVKAKYGSVSVGVAELKGSVSSELGKISQSVSAVLLNPKWEGGALAAPLDKLTPVFDVKAFEAKIKNGVLDWSLLTIGFKLKGDLTDLLSPDLKAMGLALTVEVGVERKLVPTDLATLGKLRELMDNAYTWAEELRKWKDDLAIARNLMEKEKAAIELLEQGIKTESKKPNSRTLRAMQQKLSGTVKRLLSREQEMAHAARRLKVLEKIGVQFGERFLGAIAKLSPIVKAVEKVIVRVLGERLVLLLGSSILKYAHPFIAAVMLAYDLYCIACWIRDYCRGYAGFGLGDEEYDPFERSWTDKPASEDGGGTRPGAEFSPTPLPQETKEKKAALEKAGGPRKRLLDLVRRNATDQALDDKQLGRLIDILNSVEITNELVEKILPYFNESMSPDQALDALAKALAGAKLTDKDEPSGNGGTSKLGGGGGTEDKKPKKTGGGGGGGITSGKTGGNFTLDPDDGGKFVGGGTGKLVLNPTYKTYAIYIHSAGAQMRIAGKYTPRKDGTTEFRPYATGVRVVNKRVVVNGKPAKEKIGEVLVKASYVF